MAITLRDLLGLAKELPEEYFEEAFESLNEIKKKSETEKETKPVECLRCSSIKVVRNGKQNGRQFYLCRDCGNQPSNTQQDGNRTGFR